MAAPALDDAWIETLVAASAAHEPALARSAVVEFTIGKTQRAAVEIVDGRVVGPAGEAEPDVSLPLTGAQLTDFTTGAESMTTAYMKGDLKPVGSTGALLAVLALFDDEGVRQALNG